MSTSPKHPNDYRRTMILLLSILLLAIFGIMIWYGGRQGSYKMLANATGRIGLVLAALWIAWPSLQRPIRWLPPSIAVAGVIALGVVAAQPRLVLVAVPALCTLLALTTFVRSMKR